MSEYRPWGPAPEPAPEAPATPTSGPDAATDASYAPWQQARPAPLAALSKDFEAPPGLAEAAKRRDGARGMRVAGALLLWAGGFLVIAGLSGAAWAGGLAGFMEASSAGHDPAAISQARAWQTASLAIGILAGVPAVIAGIGILYRQPWSFAAGIVAASMQLLVVPFGTLLGIVALALLLRPQGRWWFQ